MIKKYALVAETDVFYLIYMDSTHPVAEKWIAALDSGAKFVKMNHYAQCKPGYLFDGTNLYEPDDLDMKNPLPPTPMELDGERNQYAGVIDNEVIGLYTFHKQENPDGIYEMIDAGMQSDPIAVDCSNYEYKDAIVAGWTWDGTNFYPPQEG